MYLHPTDSAEISSILKDLNDSAAGNDDINIKVVKLSAHNYVNVLVHLVNLSLSQGKIPDELKIAKVIPLYKSGDEQLTNNYRPISILPCFSKIFEKIIYNRIFSFISEHNILYKYQFGFRKNHNTTIALITLIDRILMGFNDGNFTLGVFLDYSKAFDTINHSILLDKLFNYGIRGIAHHLITDYLTNRKQFVEYNSVLSSHKDISCGVPQGSILGPLLFLLYINDIYTISDSLMPILFADDCNVFIQGPNLEEIVNKMNSELKSIKLWIDCNQLSLNINKTQYMIFANRKYNMLNIPSINICDENLTRVNSVKFLGFLIDEKISWVDHIHYIQKKIAKGIGIIHRARQFLKRKTLLTLYNCFILPYLTYGLEVWGSATQSNIKALLTLQKKALRIITFSSYLSPSWPLFQSLHLLPIDKLYQTKLFIFMYKVNRLLYPYTVTQMFIQNQDIHLLNTRYKSLYRIPMFRTVKLQRNIRYRGVICFNSLSNIIDYNCSIYTLKKRLKEYFLI